MIMTAEQIMALPASKLVAILQDSSAPLFDKAKACQRLAVIGGRNAVPALAALLPDPQLSHYARFALEPNPDASASQALRDALAKVKGILLIGVMNSLAVRKDTRAIDAIAKLRLDADLEVSKAADAALAHIRPPG
jgi:hypothetical protein